MKAKRIIFAVILFVSMVCLLFVPRLVTAQSRSAPGARYRSYQQLDTLMMQLEQAYMNNDRQRMGRLIQELKTSQEVYRAGREPEVEYNESAPEAYRTRPPEVIRGGANPNEQPRITTEQPLGDQTTQPLRYRNQRDELMNQSGGMPINPSRMEGTGPAEGMSPGPRGMEPAGRRRGAPPPAAAGRGFFDNPSIARDEKEKKILDVLQDMNLNQRWGNMNVPREDGRLLRLLTESAGAKTVVEIGTSNGYSGIWFCLALQKTGGRLITCEIDEDRAVQARENFKRAGVDQMVTLVMGDAHQTVKKFDETIDILFLDADKEGYLDYLRTLLPKVRPGGLIIAHNITPRQADPRYIEAITTNPDLESLLLHPESGVSVTLKKR